MKILKCIDFLRMDREVAAAIPLCKDLLEKVLGKIAARALTMSNNLENAIPDYEPYAVTEFRTEVVKKELIDTPWEHLATSWVHLQKLHAVAKNLATSDMVGKFEAVHASTTEACERALTAGKNFIAVISTVKVILVVLPKAVKSQRHAIISNQITKTQGSGLPKNFIEYLVREQKKAAGGKQST